MMQMTARRHAESTRWRCPILALLLGLTFAGCGPSADETTATYRPEEVRAVLSEPAQVDGAEQYRTATPRQHGWTIALATFTLEGHRATAEATQRTLRDDHGLVETWIESQAEHSVLYYGDYGSRTDARLESDLARLKALEIGGRRPFLTAFLIPPTHEASGSSNPSHNLLRASRRYPAGTRLYTLQVGIYEDRDRQLAMRKAEEAVEVYRAQGDQAFYYHGPHRSSVTIGIFTDQQVQLDQPGMGMVIRQLRERHPHCAVNGKVVNYVQRFEHATTNLGPRKSELVLVPTQ
jgi:hypothetical protein